MMNREFNHCEVRKAILKSQHCQRNFDLEQTFPPEDIELLKTAVSQCPSKQNVAFYKCHFVFDRDLINKIHEKTRGFTVKTKDGEVDYQTNSQSLANLVILFEGICPTQLNTKQYTNDQIEAVFKGTATKKDFDILKQDKLLAVGIAAGYLNLVASLMGYVTGCCSCFDEEEDIMKIAGLKGPLLLIMGIGFKDVSRNRREHHIDKDFIFPSKRKQPIEINTIGL